MIRFAGLNQPSWTMNLPRDVVGNTKDVVNWGLMTYYHVNGAASPTYNALKNVQTIDIGPGDVTVIEGHMRLRSQPEAYPGLAAAAARPRRAPSPRRTPP